MMTVSYQLKNMFFDRAKVQSMVDQKTHRFLYRAGGRVRTIAIRSMRRVGKKGKPSAVGTPPKWHGDTNFSLRTIFFGFESRYSVIVGPTRGNAKIEGVPSIPYLHEQGGTIVFKEKKAGTRWISLGRRARPGQPVRKRRATYPARPFMGPAVRTLKTKYPEYTKLWFGGGGFGTGSAAGAA